MLTKLNYTVSADLLQEAANSLPSEDFKSSINSPTGSFFYDPWVIKPEFENTVWNKILSTLPFEVGEARIIVLSYGDCYQSHGDIDDRYHVYDRCIQHRLFVVHYHLKHFFHIRL